MMNRKVAYVLGTMLLAMAMTSCGIFQAKLPIITLTLDDHNRTFTFQVGQKVELELANGYQWFNFVPEPHIFKQVIDSNTLPGIQGVYLAQRVGQTQLEARGEPTCKLERTPCTKEDIYFKINVIVEERL